MNEHGCPYSSGSRCEDMVRLGNDENKKPGEYESLRDQYNELCRTPSFETCSNYKTLNLGENK